MGMRPNVFLLPHDGGPRVRLVLAFKEADHATVEGEPPCPECGAKVWGVQGSGSRPSADDRAYEADGYATCCKARVGTIRFEPDTLFGVREDRAVLQGRCRVY
jgi:hypothetical protein